MLAICSDTSVGAAHLRWWPARLIPDPGMLEIAIKRRLDVGISWNLSLERRSTQKVGIVCAHSHDMFLHRINSV